MRYADDVCVSGGVLANTVEEEEEEDGRISELSETTGSTLQSVCFHGIIRTL